MLSYSQKKYLFAIYALGQDGNKVRSTAVAKFLCVAKSSTVKMTQRLIDDGYIIKEPYGEIELTPLGIKEANELFTPNVILKDFLVNKVGVAEHQAQLDAVTMSVQLSQETLEKLVQYALELS